MTVLNLWCGAVKPAGATVKAKVTGTSCRLAVSTVEAMTGAVFTTAFTPALGIATLTTTGLAANTQYYYQVEEDGALTGPVGRFRTLPVAGAPASFRLAAIACANGENFPGATAGVSNTPIYGTIADADPLMALHLGDMHYRDIFQNLPASYRQAFDDVLAESNPADFFRRVPFAYTWDDHDYGSNNSNKNGAQRPAATQVYRERVPHYPLPDATAIYQTFTIGRVRVIISDSRSEKDDESLVDDASKRIFSATQEAWLIDLLTNSPEPVICWVQSFPWLGAATTFSGEEHWSRYNTQRQRIGDAIYAAGVGDRIFMLSGDAHCLAYDTGAGNPWGGFPVFQFAALSSGGSSKGGPYGGGFKTGPNQYGLVDISDDGQEITVTGTGYTGSTVWKSHSFTVAAPARGRKIRVGGVDRTARLLVSGVERAYTVQ